MIIGIDVDGVLSDIGNYQLKYSKPYFKKKYNKDIVNPDKFDIEQIYDCTHKEREIFWQKYILLNRTSFQKCIRSIAKASRRGKQNSYYYRKGTHY